MFVSGRPLLDTRADARLFVDREDELAALHRAVDAGLNSMVLGARGSGKTSVLHLLAYELREQHRNRVEFVDAGPAAANAAALLGLITARLLGEAVDLTAHSTLTIGAPPDVPADLVAAVERLRAHLPERQATPPNVGHELAWDPSRPVVVLLDGPPPEVAHTLFGRLRDELWRLPVLWVVSGDVERRADYLRPPADAFFDAQVSLESLTPKAARELLRRRLDATDGLGAEDIDRIVAGTDRTPRALLTSARRHLADPSSSNAAAQKRRERAFAVLGQLGRPATMLVSEVQSRGGAASASDEGLLQSLGWTRPRAVQVFKELEEHGLVVATPQRSDGPGRPKIVYELVEDIL
ncbi:MAG TPA: ATP-binding protein [Frankiaceae bacterium]|nr:ATP-binding protein [Frankiaceae bacterium]